MLHFARDLGAARVLFVVRDGGEEAALRPLAGAVSEALAELGVETSS